jgi:aspartate aminotransferase
MNYQSARALRITPSASMVVSLEARRMQSEGHRVIDLSLGESDFATPDHIIAAAYAAMTSGFTRYTGPAGTEELRTAIAAKLLRENGLTYGPDEITVANGAKQIIFNALLATLEPGDEVVIPAPYWVSYTDMVVLHGGQPRVVPCGIETDFKLSPERLEAAITERTRWLILNSPSNPSGAAYSRDDLEAIGEVLVRHPRVFVASDEIYEHIIWGNTRFLSFAQACPQLRDRTLVVNGVSKAYAMTGWRIGYAAGPRSLVAGLSKMQSQSTTCASSISQVAATAALDGPQDFVRRSAVTYGERAALTIAALRRVPGLEVTPPQGAFYAFPKCTAYIGNVTPDGDVIKTDSDLARFLLRSGKVAAVPGAAFGMEPYLRFSFTADAANLEMALSRVAESLATLKPAKSSSSSQA